MRIPLVLLLLLSVLGGASGQNSAPWNYLPQDRQSALVQTGETTVLADSVDHLCLWKGSPFQGSVSELFSGRGSTLAAEGLFLVPVNLPADPTLRNQKLAQALTSVSTMKDLQVYSLSLGRMETFIFDAYRVSDLVKDHRLPDPSAGESVAGTSFPMYLNEEQTGASFARLQFHPGPDWALVNQTNLTTLSYGIVPLVSPGDLLTAVYVVPLDGKILVYGVTEAKTPGFFGLERTKTASLFTRMRALVTWLTRNLGGDLK